MQRTRTDTKCCWLRRGAKYPRVILEIKVRSHLLAAGKATRSIKLTPWRKPTFRSSCIKRTARSYEQSMAHSLGSELERLELVRPAGIPSPEHVWKLYLGLAIVSTAKNAKARNKPKLLNVGASVSSDATFKTLTGQALSGILPHAAVSHFKIGGDKRIYQHLSRSTPRAPTASLSD
jgi:hypothetical protein